MIDVYKIAFASLRGMGVELAKKILDVIPSEEEYFKMSHEDLVRLTGCRTKIIETGYRNDILEKAKREIEFIGNNKISILYYTSSEYPQRLLEAPDAPILLYGTGDCNLNAPHIISVVGTRHATQYGKSVTEELIKNIASAQLGTVIISGLAYGIDICAHKAALSNSLPTVGVLAHGLNTIYPAAHRKTAVEIVKSDGMLLTDYMSQDVIHRGNFLARNRIVAALSDCTLVSESAEKGGALVTAAIANSYNRDVFAFPGRINDKYSAGCNNLIKRNKAIAITNAEDLFDAMGWDTEKTLNTSPSLFPEYTDDEQKVINFLTENGDTHINRIANELNLPVHKAMSLMVDMEFKGYVKAVAGGKYIIK